MMNVNRIPLLDRPILSVQEACEITGFSNNTLRAAMRSGALVARQKAAKRFVIMRKDLDAWLEAMPPVARKENVVKYDLVPKKTMGDSDK